MAEHYYTTEPSSEIKEKVYSQEIRGVTLDFKTVSGVFSFESRVDKASELLIEHYVPSPSTRSVLDLGCGYGAIGLYIKALYPELSVTLADINNRAIAYAKQNAGRNGLSVEAVQSDLYSAFEGRLFDDIVTNPPIAAGKKLNTQLISQALNYLKPNGSLWMVAFHNKGGSTLKDIMKEFFLQVEDIEKKGGIRVYRSVRPSA